MDLESMGNREQNIPQNESIAQILCMPTYMYTHRNIWKVILDSVKSSITSHLQPYGRCLGNQKMIKMEGCEGREVLLYKILGPAVNFNRWLPRVTSMKAVDNFFYIKHQLVL